MPDAKISQLTDGDPALSTDLIPIERAGTNFAVSAGTIAELAPLPTLPELLVAAPAHYNSPGVAGDLAIGNDGGSPPSPAFFICLVSSVASPPSNALWLRINDAGVFSTSF
ncbi:MAG TPA: hypothetical protein VK302_00105 [Terriglobales bacterium]|nr:hypothetical protein [Terriglobales bacterium]